MNFHPSIPTERERLKIHLTRKSSQPEVILYPRWIFNNIYRHFWVPQWGVCYWHLVGAGQGAGKRPIMHSQSPTAKNYLAWMSVVLKLRKPHWESRWFQRSLLALNHLYQWLSVEEPSSEELRVKWVDEYVRFGKKEIVRADIGKV